jgi:hypothetical protein
MDLGKFNPDDFETHETAFINLLAQMYGEQAKTLSILCVMSLFLLSLLMMPKGVCISYPLQARLTAWAISQFTIC